MISLEWKSGIRGLCMYSGASGRLQFESDYYNELMMGFKLTTGETG